MAEGTLTRAFRPAVRVVREHGRAFVLIQAAAVAVVVLYYSLPAMRALGETVAVWKERGGLAFVTLTTVFASVVLPLVAKRLTEPSERGKSINGRDLLFQCAFFFTVGIIVDIVYRMQTVWFGDGNDIRTLATKVLVDQLVLATFLFIPYSALAFLFRDLGFRWGATWTALWNGEFARRYVATLVTGWSFWIPVLVAVYAMPAALQFWLYLFVQACWALLLAHIKPEEPACAEPS